MLEAITNVWSWITAHYTEIVSVVTTIISALLTIIGALEVVAKWTETDKDDKIVSKMRVILNKINKIIIEIISYITKLRGTK